MLLREEGERGNGEPSRRIRARDKRFSPPPPPPLAFFLTQDGEGEGGRRDGKREWRHFFVPPPPPPPPPTRPRALRETKRNSHTRSLACIDGYFPLLFVSINRVLSSVAAVHDNPAVPRRLALPSSPSIPTADLPMEARSRDKLGQPIEELNPAVSEGRDRAARASPPPPAPPRPSSPLLSSGGGRE